MRQVTDKETGAVMLIEPAGKNHLDIYMRLKDERHRRRIGVVNLKTATLHVERNSKEHLLNKADAYGFNHYILSNAKRFEHVVLHETDTNKVYRMERKFMLNEGQFLFFKQQGFEKQIFLTREWIAHYEITTEQGIRLLRQEYKLDI